MRLKLLQELYREHAIATACADGQIIYRHALPPAAWLNQRLEAMGQAWRIGTVAGTRCTFVDRDRYLSAR